MENNIIIQNRKAKFDFQLEKSIEAGICLIGWEVKSLMEGKVQLIDSYVRVINDEAWLIGSLITPLITSNQSDNLDPRRDRKLLLNKKEIFKLKNSIEKEGMTVVCLDIHRTNGKFKANIAVAKGKKSYDKRLSIKNRELSIEAKKIFKYKK